MVNPRSSSLICSSCMRALKTQQSRLFSTRRTATDPQLPRWRQTPPAMKQPFRLRPHPPKTWKVNEEQEPLDVMYDRLLSQLESGSGKQGRDLLPENVKWLAVTHKSFDHGRQGFNDKLAYLGKRVLDLQASLALKRAPPAPLHLPRSEVFRHPSLEGLENVSAYAREQVLDRVRLANLATKYGVDKVLRWKPRDPDKLIESGQHTVLAHALYSIIGALAMHRGGATASRAVRDKILQPLGLL